MCPGGEQDGGGRILQDQGAKGKLSQVLSKCANLQAVFMYVGKFM